MNKAARVTSKFPDSDYLRKNYYKVKKKYKSLVKSKKKDFFDKLNQDIEAGKILNWKQFKKLKSLKTRRSDFDAYDMENFEDFFRQLYANEHTTISSQTKEGLLRDADLINSNCENSSNLLNGPITIAEISNSIIKR